MFLSTLFSQTILLTPTSITNFTSAVAVFALGIFIYKRNHDDQVNQLAFAMALFLGFWAMSSTLSDVMHEPAPALFWARAAIIGPFFFPAFFLIFSYVFPVSNGRLTAWKAILIFLPALVVLALVGSPLNIDAISLAEWGTDFTPGILYPVGILYQILYTVLASVNFIRARKAAHDQMTRTQIKFVLYTIVFVTVCQFFINALLPAAFGYTKATVFGPATSVLFVLFLSYAIFRHGLLNLKIIATETFAVLLNFLAFIQIFWASSIIESLSRLLMLLVTLMVGLMLIRSVRSEVKRREEIQQLATQLSASNKRLRQLDNLKTTMVSIASHQIRGPLGGIRGYLTMFRDGDLGQLTDKQKEIIKLNLNVLTRLLNAVETFLDITKLESGALALRKEVTPIDVMVENVVREFEMPAKKKGVALSLSFLCDRNTMVEFDPEKTSHVVFNLVDNALKYTEQGAINAVVRCEKGEAIFEVTDSGMGIPGADLPRLFGKYERGELVVDRGGSGLGLYVVKMLIEMQGGRVWAKSDGPGKGATFGFALPVVQ